MKKISEIRSPEAARLAEEALFHNPCASAMEFTGCIPRIPEDEFDAAFYCDVLDIPITALDGTEAYNLLFLSEKK